MSNASIVSKLDEQVERAVGMAFRFASLSFREKEAGTVSKLDEQGPARSRNDIYFFADCTRRWRFGV